MYIVTKSKVDPTQIRTVTDRTLKGKFRDFYKVDKCNVFNKVDVVCVCSANAEVARQVISQGLAEPIVQLLSSTVDIKHEVNIPYNYLYYVGNLTAMKIACYHV